MKIMFNTNANKGEKIPATSIRCFDTLLKLSSVRPVPCRSVRFWLATRNKKVYTLLVRLRTNRSKVRFPVAEICDAPDRRFGN